jgi:hypothetical protein
LYEETRISVERAPARPIAQNSIRILLGRPASPREQTPAFYAVAVGSVAVSLGGLDRERATTDKATAGSRPKTSKRASAPPTGIPDLIRAPRRQRPPGTGGE